VVILFFNQKGGKTMFESEHYQQSLNLEFGWLCLDFANTASWHASDSPEEHIHNFDDLFSWTKDVGIIYGQQAEQILQMSIKNPNRAKKVHQMAIILRESIYQIFSARATNKQPKLSDLVILNTLVSKALSHLKVVSSDDVFTWEWIYGEDDLEQILWPIARSAAVLLTSKEINRVGECPDDRGCGWLFLDTSRNRSRRWCDMKDCGNRDKVRRYYKKKRKSGD